MLEKHRNGAKFSKEGGIPKIPCVYSKNRSCYYSFEEQLKVLREMSTHGVKDVIDIGLGARTWAFPSNIIRAGQMKIRFR